MTDFEVNFNFENREPVILDATLAPRPQIETEFIINAHTAVATWGSITGLLSNQTDLNNILTSKADKTTTVNGYPLSNNITLKLSDLTNDTNFITLSSLSSSATGLSYNNTTGVFSLTSGYTIPLSSTLNTFITKNVNDLTNYRLSASQDIIDTQLQANITAETNARISADSTLDGRITTETTNRTNADTVLQNNINTEIQNRANADTNLEEAITVNTNSIATEISNRQSADTTLQNNITAEATARANSDTALSNSITSHTGNTSNPHSVTKAQVGLGNVDNTSDLNKPISTATQNALNNKANASTVNNLSTRVGNIEGVIPTQASSNNKLTDKNYVDNSISTSIGTGNLTIQKNGTSLIVFNANSSANKTANIEVPTKTSDITNDSGYIDLTDLSSTSPSLTYDNSNGQFSVTSGYSITTSIEKNQIGINADDIDDIQELIPTQATSSNQLADKDFVNSTIQTGTANFRGNWNNWASVPLYASEYPLDYQGNRTPHVNDYMVVQTTTDYAPLYSNSRPYPLNFIVYYNNQLYKCIQAIITPEEFTPSKWQTVSVGSYSGVWRFKYNGIWTSVAKEGWQPEYRVNEEPFTQAQLKAINSGITDTLTAQITTNKNNITTINNTLSTYGDIVTHDADEFVLANNAITGATKCKVTYDSKGLVTNGSDLTASDIPSLNLTKISDITATASEVNILDGATVTTSELNVLDGITTSTTELNYLDGATSNIQTQLDNKVEKNDDITGATHTKITYDSKGLVTNGADLQASDIPNLTLSKITDVTATASELNILDGITATTTELNYVDGVTSNIQTQLNSKVETLPDLSITATASELNILDGATLTTTELNYVDGVTSNIQTQLNNKVVKNNDITAGTNCKITYDSKGLVTGGTTLSASDIPSLTLAKITDVTASTTEVNYCKGVTSGIQTQLDSCVKTTGNQTVAGIKTFTGNPVFSGNNLGNQLTVTRTNNANGYSVISYKNADTLKGYIGISDIGRPIYGNPSGTFVNLVKNSTLNTATGSTTTPVYIDANGVATACTSYANYHDNTKADKIYQDYKSCTGGNIVLEDNKSIYCHVDISSNTTFTFDTSSLTKYSNNFATFELIFKMDTTYQLTFPSNLIWLNNETPNFQTTGIYMLSFRKRADWGSWRGCLEGIS